MEVSRMAYCSVGNQTTLGEDRNRDLTNAQQLEIKLEGQRDQVCSGLENLRSGTCGSALTALK